MVSSQPDTVAVRQAYPHDIQGVLHVENACFDEHNYQVLVRLCGFSDTFLVYDVGDQIAGYILAVPVGSEDARVLSVGVLPEYRQNGFGRALMNEAIRRLRSKGFETLSLEVRVSNTAAKSLYHDLGFVKVGRKDSYYSDGEDAFDMKMKL